LLYPSHLLAENIPLIKKGGVYEIPVEINGVITLNFVLDTGASEVNIPADVALTLYRAGTIKDADFLPGKTYSLADGSQVNSSRFVLRSLKIGQRRITNVAASIGGVSSSLLLGQSFLEKLGAWGIDNKRNILTINPDSTLRATHESDRFPVSSVPQISSSPPIVPIVGVWKQYFYDAYGKLVYGGTYRVTKQQENYVMREDDSMKASNIVNSLGLFDITYDGDLWTFRSDWGNGLTGYFRLRRVSDTIFEGESLPAPHTFRIGSIRSF